MRQTCSNHCLQAAIDDRTHSTRPCLSATNHCTTRRLADNLQAWACQLSKALTALSAKLQIAYLLLLADAQVLLVLAASSRLLEQQNKYKKCRYWSMNGRQHCWWRGHGLMWLLNCFLQVVIVSYCCCTCSNNFYVRLEKFVLLLRL